MLEKMFEDIMVSKYTGYTLYAHNFNKFDSVFNFRILSKKKITKKIPPNTGLFCFNVTHRIGKNVIKKNYRFYSITTRIISFLMVIF